MSNIRLLSLPGIWGHGHVPISQSRPNITVTEHTHVSRNQVSCEYIYLKKKIYIYMCVFVYIHTQPGFWGLCPQPGIWGRALPLLTESSYSVIRLIFDPKG